MSKIFIFILKLAACSTCFLVHCNAQNVRQYVRENIKEIKQIDFNDNFEDLQSVGDAIGNHRVVMLGEQSHGDGSTFRFKARLVKYLHEMKDSMC